MNWEATKSLFRIRTKSLHMKGKILSYRVSTTYLGTATSGWLSALGTNVCASLESSACLVGFAWIILGENSSGSPSPLFSQFQLMTWLNAKPEFRLHTQIPLTSCPHFSVFLIAISALTYSLRIGFLSPHKG